MKGAIIGDIAGSVYEFDKTADSLDFPLFTRASRFTDDTVTTVAVAAALVAEVSEVPVSKINPKRENIQMYA